MRVFNRCFVVLFMAMIILPLVFIDLSSDRVSAEENRMLAERPKITDIKKHPGKFIHDFDVWFKDSTGFRKQLLALYNVMKMYTRSGIYYKNGLFVYLVGEKGHHFFVGKNEHSIRIFQGKSILSDEQLADMANKLEETKNYLDRKGIPFIVMFCAIKEEIYPEFYPKSIKRGPEPILLDVITNYLREHTSVDVFNIRQALLAEKDNYLLYPVSSGDLAHYTEIGAFFAYRELMKHINKYFPDIVPYELNDIDISYDKDERGRVIPVVSLKTKTAYKKLDMSFFDDVELIRPFTWENVAYENADKDLPAILFLRDSYSEFFYENRGKFLAQFMASHFSRAIFIHYNNMKHFEEYVDKYKPDLIVFETIQPYNFWQIVADIPELP